jgi:hypothetical protein
MLELAQARGFVIAAAVVSRAESGGFPVLYACRRPR